MFNNVSHPAIIKLNNDNEPIEVLEVVPPPELHILLGVTNTLYKGVLADVPEVDRFLKTIHVEREAMHGGSFTGNSCKTILRNTKLLEEMAPTNCSKYIKALKRFGDVVSSCFGVDLDESFKTNITLFKEAFLETGLNVTPKVHAAFFHVEEFCSRKRMGLGLWSEQVSESIHYDFLQTWKDFKISDISHKNYGSKLLKAVIIYNSRHI